MVRDEDTYPIDTIVRIRKTGQFAIIVDKAFLKDGKGFMNYLAQIEGKEGSYALYHEDIDLEALPLNDTE
jgi:hypothetical protein